MIAKYVNITSGPRESNFELLRIIAMYLVLVVHADFASLGVPEWSDFTHDPTESLIKTSFEALSIGCVNLFILISGWFGIKPSAKGFLKFVFQCAYFMFGIYIILVAFGTLKLSLKGIMECVALTPANWFVKAYIGLYILSPLLNAFSNNATLKTQTNVVIAFFLFQTIYGITNAAQFIDFGYSTFSFIGLYLLADLLRKTLRSTTMSKVNCVSLKWGGDNMHISSHFKRINFCPVQMDEHISPSFQLY